MCQLLFMVRVTGLEPVRRETHAPQTCLSTSSSTLAFSSCRVASLSATRIIIHTGAGFVNDFLKVFLKKIERNSEAGKNRPKTAG